MIISHIVPTPDFGRIQMGSVAAVNRHRIVRFSKSLILLNFSATAKTD